MMHSSDPKARFAFEFWDGDSIRYGDPPRVTLRLKNKDSAKRIVGDAFLGFAESYMWGDLEIEGDIEELLRLGYAINFERHRLPLWQKFRFFIFGMLSRGTLRRAPKNISHHYDRGNELYALYLDRTMTYSCAYFKSEDDSLEQAQLNKYEHTCRKLLLKPGESLLDIGCGWGGMLIYAAQKYGINGLGITLSKNQHEYANRKIKELGLQDQIRVLYQDYRDLSGKFDKVVSIGMFEHVGKKYIPIFIQKTSALLKDGGVGLLHTIGGDSPSPTNPWILKYIFPGGYIPALEEIVHEMGKNGISVLDVENLRLHYAKTLEHWAANYERNAERVQKISDDAFVRQWRLFLYASMAAFKYGDNRLYHILFSKGLNNALPITREHVYQE